MYNVCRQSLLISSCHSVYKLPEKMIQLYLLDLQVAFPVSFISTSSYLGDSSIEVRHAVTHS